MPPAAAGFCANNHNSFGDTAKTSSFINQCCVLPHLIRSILLRLDTLRSSQRVYRNGGRIFDAAWRYSDRVLNTIVRVCPLTVTPRNVLMLTYQERTYLSNLESRLDADLQQAALADSFPVSLSEQLYKSTRIGDELMRRYRSSGWTVHYVRMEGITHLRFWPSPGSGL